MNGPGGASDAVTDLKLIEAEASLRRKLDEDPADRATRESLLFMIVRAGRPADALIVADELVAQAALEARYHVHRGNLLRLLGRKQEAAKAYERGTACDPPSANAYFNLGVLELDHGAGAKAEFLLSRCLEIDPQHAAARYNLAWLRHARGDLVGAEEEYRRVLALPEQSISGLAPSARVEAWNNLGNLCKDAERFGEAADCYEQVLALDPGRPALRHLVLALRGAAEEKIAPEAVRDLFDRYAERFEQDLRERLGYRIPEEFLELLEANGLTHVSHTLDLGCGTGLLGRLLRPVTDRLTGIDLSSAMLARARASEVYDALEEDDVCAFLERTAERYDLIAAADVLGYLGSLESLFRGVSHRLAPGGHVVLSTESAREGETFALRPSGRFVHHFAYVLATAGACGLQLVDHRTTTLRIERGQPVAADLFLFAS